MNNNITIKVRERYYEVEEYVIDKRTLIGIERDYYNDELILEKGIDLTDEGFETVDQFIRALVRLDYELVYVK